LPASEHRKTTSDETQIPSSYPPPAQFAGAGERRVRLVPRAEEDRLAFWAKQPTGMFWATPFHRVLDGPKRRSPSGSSAAS